MIIRRSWSLAALAASASCWRRKLSLPLLASFSNAESIVRPTLTGIFSKSTYFDFNDLERSRSTMVVSAMALFLSGSGARIAAWSDMGWEGTNPQQGGNLRLTMQAGRPGLEPKGRDGFVDQVSCSASISPAPRAARGRLMTLTC